MSQRSNITLRIESQDAEAVRSFLKLTQEERNLEMQTKKTNQALRDKAIAQKKAGDEAWKASKSAAAFIGGFIGITSIAGGIMAITSELKRVDEALGNIGRKSNKVGNDILEFVALQAQGDKGQKNVKSTLLQGAAAGVSLRDTAAMAVPIQSVVDANGDGLLQPEEQAKFDEDMKAAFVLRNLGVSPEDAQTVITAGRARGQGGTKSADKFSAAASAGGATTAQFAGSISALSQFTDTDTGLAALASLTREEKNFGRLPTMLRNLGGVLGSQADESEFSKKFGLKGLSEAEKVAKLRELAQQRGKGDTEAARLKSFTDTFQNEGLSKREAEALGIVVRQGGFMEQVRGQLGALEPGVAQRRLDTVFQDPVVKGTKDAETVAALSEYAAAYGPQSEAGRENLKGKLAVGAEAVAEGRMQNVDIETGEPNWRERARDYFGRFVSEGQPTQGPNMGAGGLPVGMGRPEIRNDGVTNDERLGQKLDRLADVLEKSIQTTEQNNAATEANTNASRGKAPVGGAASNAEEKY